MTKKNPHWLAFSGLGIQMVMIMILCWWIGGKLEDSFNIITEPWGQISGLFFGIFSVIYNLINQIK